MTTTGVDNRLYSIVTRPGKLRRQDLPLVARAIVSLFRGQAQIKTGHVKNVSYVRIVAHDFRVQILASDWAKIDPYIRSDAFNQVVVKSQVDTVWIDPGVAFDSSIIDRTDREYYLRVYYTLLQLFPEAYPTSNL